MNLSSIIRREKKVVFMGFGFYKRGLVYEVRGDFGVASCYILFNIKTLHLRVVSGGERRS